MYNNYVQHYGEVSEWSASKFCLRLTCYAKVHPATKLFHIPKIYKRISGALIALYPTQRIFDFKRIK